MLQLSYHSIQRAAQRNLSPEDLQYVMTHAQRFHRAGGQFCFLRACDIPNQDRPDGKKMRLVGTAVVLSKDGREIITVWRNRKKGLKRIKRKVKYDARRHLLAEHAYYPSAG